MGGQEHLREAAVHQGDGRLEAGGVRDPPGNEEGNRINFHG